jgi:hypothetical protein
MVFFTTLWQLEEGNDWASSIQTLPLNWEPDSSPLWQNVKIKEISG